MKPGTEGDDLEPIDSEILASYADLVRAGQLMFNDVPLTWDTLGSKEQQLRNFGSVFCEKLRQAHASASEEKEEVVAEEIIRRAIYWICKATSFNYVIIEVVLMLRKKAGGVSTIQTRNEQGRMVDYFADLLPGPRLQIRAGLRWSWEGNILAVRPDNDEKCVKGTLVSLTTTFDCPPELGWAPVYEVELKLKRPLAERLACELSAVLHRQPSASNTESLRVGRPLRSSEHPLTQLQPAAITPLWVGSDEPPIGRLRISIVRAWGLPQAGGSSVCTCTRPHFEPYVTCVVAGGGAECHTDVAAGNTPDPVWNQDFWFELRAQDLLGYVLVQVFDAGSRKEEHLLGRACVQVSNALCPGGCTPVKLGLGGAHRGFIDIELEFNYII